MSTLTWPKPWPLSISRKVGVLDCKASRVTALWLTIQTWAWSPCTAMRTSMGPSAGGFTCSFALVMFLSTMVEI